MKPKFRHLRSLAIASSALLCISSASAQSTLYWDGGIVDIAGNGNGASAGGTGTWNTTLLNWDAGVASHVAWDNTAPLDTAVFGGTAGTVTLGTGITAGGLTFTTGGYTITGNTLTLAGTSAPIIDATTGTTTISSEIAGSDGLTKTGAGTLVLRRDSGSNTYTGTTTLSAGTLQANAGTSLIASIANPLGTSALQLNGGTLQLRADSAASGATATTIAWNNNTTVGGNVTINVERVGGSGSNKIHQLGTLSIGAHILTATDVTSANHDLRFGATTLTGNATFNVTNTGGSMNLTLGAITQSSAGLSITKTGNGTLTLSGASDHTGGTSISGGALTISNSNQLGASGSRNLTFTGSATLNTSGTPSLNVLTVNNGATATISNNTVTFASTTGSGNITFNGANNSTQVLNLGNASAFTGNLQNNIGGHGTNLPGKLIQFSALGDSVGSRMRFGGGDGNGSQAARYVFSGASAPLIMDNRQVEFLARTSGNNSFDRAILQNDNSSAANKWVITTNLINTTDRNHFFELRGTNTGDNEFAGTIINSANGGVRVLSLNKVDAGRWILSGTNSYTGATNISGGTLQVTTLADGGSNSSIGASGNGAGNLLLGNGATLRYAGASASTDRRFTINGTSAGHGASLNASGTGAISFTNTASPSYGTTNQTRTLTLTGTNTGDNTLAANIANNGTGAVSLAKTDIGTWVLSGTNTYTGTTTISGGVLQAIQGTGIATNSGISLNGGVFQSSGTFNRNVGAVSAAGSTTYNMTAAGGGFSAIDGKFTVNLDDTVNVRNWGSTVSTSPLVGTLKFGSTSSNAEVEMTNNINFNGTDRTIEVTAGVGGDFATMSGVLSNSTGTAGFAKTGTGRLVLANANSYNGATTVSAGTLLVNGSTNASSTVGVSAGATLGGTGTIGGAVNVSGVLSPGASIETLGSGTLSFANGSSLVHELDSSVATSVGSDLLKVTGNLNLAGTVGLTLSDLALTDVAFNVDDVFSVINYTGTWNGGLFSFEGNELANASEFTFGLNTWRIDYDATSGGSNFFGEQVAGSFVNLTVLTAVPEPSSVALLGTLGVMMLLRRRR